MSYPYSAGPLFTDGLQRMALSPAEAEGQGLPGAGPADWTNYSAVSSIGNTWMPEE